MGSNKHFNWLAPFYDKLFGEKEPERLGRLLRLPEAGKLLDAGGGTGRVGEMLRPKRGHVVVADISVSMLRQAARKDGLQTVGAAAEALPFPNDYFDAVLMVDAFHHVADQRRTAAELFRVVRPGGAVVIEEPDIRTPVVKVVAVMEKLALMRSHFLAPHEIANLFRLPQARARMEWEGFNAWVVIEKIASVIPRELPEQDAWKSTEAG